MRYIVLIYHVNKGLEGMVSSMDESSEPILKGTLKEYLENDIHWSKYPWNLEEGKEGTNYVEYTNDIFSASYQIYDGKFAECYSPANDDSLWFIGDVLCGRKKLTNV